MYDAFLDVTFYRPAVESIEATSSLCVVTLP